MTTDNIFLQNRLIQTIQTGGQGYSDTSPFSIPWPNMTERLSLGNPSNLVLCNTLIWGPIR
jgi:hypothetical protein